LPKLELAVPVVVQTSPERAFDWFTDYHHVAKVLEGVNRWEPIGEQTEGIGARYAVEMLALGIPLHSVLRLDRWRRPSEIGWISESGIIRQRGGFTFAPQARGVKIELRIEYEPPASVIGAAVARRIDGFVRRRLETAMQNIKATLES
jgi:ribosome-associated toxin RatA of RatAB toxin-antitoxin module